MKKRYKKNLGDVATKDVATRSSKPSEDSTVLEVIPEFDSILELPTGIKEKTLVETICKRHKAKKDSSRNKNKKQDVGSWLTDECKKMHTNDN